MKQSSWRTSHAWAVAAPLLCAVHCAAMPLVVLVLPALAPASRLEGVLLVVAALLVGAVLVRGVRTHGSIAPGIGAGGGLALWAASLAGWLLPVPEPVTTVVGSVAVAGAMLWNATLAHRASCHHCACAACEEPAKVREEVATGRRYREGWSATG
jgi:hypothetical protein